MSESVLYHCPCCGHRGLSQPAYYELPPPPWGDLGDPPYGPRFGGATFGCCDCCGFEFGYDDDPAACGAARSFRQYLADFVAGGCVWFYPDRRPAGWSLGEQLQAVGIEKPEG